MPLFRIMSSSLTLTVIARHCSGHLLSNLCSMFNIKRYGCSILDAGFPMTSNNPVWTFFHCKAVSGGFNGMVVVLCGGIVTIVDVFSCIPFLLAIVFTCVSTI